MVVPGYPGTGGGLPMGSKADRDKFLGQVHKTCHVGRRLREWGVRPNGVVRFDSVCSVEAWSEDPKGNQKRIAETFREACKIAEDHGERLAVEGEICWGGMHSWRRMIELLEMVDRRETLGFQADMSHTLLFLMGYNAPEDALLPQDFDWNNQRSSTRPTQSSPPPCGRGRSISTWPKTMERSTAPARTARPAGIAWPPIPRASWTSSATPATGCATGTAS